jgi:TetR/AcrR family transcriptional regulator of autoinduction and epiphytic fitness
MSSSPKPKRPYNSTRRQAQARQTRRLIIAAAGRLFTERGYGGASIEAIAQEAGVAVETIYAAFGNKVSILSGLVDFSVVGDDEPVPLMQRPGIQSARAETDPRRLLEHFAGDVDAVMARMSPIFSLLRTAAKNEPEIAVLLDRLLKERLQGMAFLVEQLERTHGLRPGIDPQAAAETVWALSSAEVFHLLTVDRGWPREKYRAWLVDSLARLLLN